MLIMVVLWLPIILFGIIMYNLVKNGTIHPAIKWWSPMTKKILKYEIDDRYEKVSKIKIDAICFISFGAGMTVLFSTIFIIVKYIGVTKEYIVWPLFIILFIVISKFTEFISVKILIRLNVLN